MWILDFWSCKATVLEIGGCLLAWLGRIRREGIEMEIYMCPSRGVSRKRDESKITMHITMTDCRISSS